jgi:alkanesulfonate monooxygenase SsuD/methylene tetrahydromethanopterin reductase-like flavin-dependent oxidoreductase (luciferase family)
MEGDGDGFYQQPRVELRPRPDFNRQHFGDGRAYSIGMSPASVRAAAANGTGLMAFTGRSAEEHAEQVEIHREAFREYHGKEAPPPVFAMFMYCDPHEGRVVENVEYTKRFGIASLVHYENANVERWERTPGYESYIEGAREINEIGLDAAGQAFADSQLSGTPEQVLEKLGHWHDVVGEFELMICASHGGMPMDTARKSYETFTSEVLPALQADRYSVKAETR